MTFRIREADLGDADLGTFTAVVNETTPDDPTSVDEMRWSTATYPGTSRFILETGGRPVGTASVGRIYVYPPDFDAFWATVNVLADARRQGFGAALLAAVSERALAAGKVALHVPVSDGRPDGVEFFLHRGFREHDRNKTVHLELAGLAPPAVDLPAGVSLTTLADRPDLIEGVHAVAVEAFADIPGGETPMAAGDLEEFRKRDVDRPSIPPAAFFIATEDATGRVVGYACLLLQPPYRRRIAWHDMTAVARDWRGRGLATALKRATIGWAIADGIDLLEAGNDTDNLAMRTVNARLGYVPSPDSLTLRGELVGGKMDR
jgi:GNAT superfamily N-acetyltransferase